jgi:hypothetical protein
VGALPGVERVGVSLGGGETTGSEEVGVLPTGKTATSYTLSLYAAPHDWLGLPEQATPQVLAS